MGAGLYYRPRNCTLSGITFLLYARAIVNKLRDNTTGPAFQASLPTYSSLAPEIPDNKLIYDTNLLCSFIPGLVKHVVALI